MTGSLANSCPNLSDSIMNDAHDILDQDTFLHLLRKYEALEMQAELLTDAVELLVEALDAALANTDVSNLALEVRTPLALAYAAMYKAYTVNILDASLPTDAPIPSV